jgi:hypothetical protein
MRDQKEPVSASSFAKTDMTLFRNTGVSREMIFQK